MDRRGWTSEGNRRWRRMRSEGVKFLKETGRGRVTMCRNGWEIASYLT